MNGLQQLDLRLHMFLNPLWFSTRAQCEELRSTLSKRHQDTVCLERLEQLRQKEQIAHEKRAQEDMYAKLWEQDMLAKAAREEREAKDLHERNR